MSKKIMALLMAVVMVVGLTGVTAFADEEVCWHFNGFNAVSNNDGTHTMVCVDCKDTHGSGNCEYVNGACKDCGYAEPAAECHHAGNNFSYVSNKNNTHNTVCNDCKAVIFENAACYFEDGVCVACGAKKIVETKPAAPVTTTTSPKTGEEANLTLWVVVSVLGLAGAAVYGKKSRLF